VSALVWPVQVFLQAPPLTIDWSFLLSVQVNLPSGSELLNNVQLHFRINLIWIVM
jgi:hypothetical protein